MGSGTQEKPICVDLFCGAGGLSDGLRQAGFDPILGVDYDENCILTYRENHKNTAALCKDISQVSGDEILDACEGRELDLLAGGPSCQGYSTHGKRIEDDPRNFLFEHFVRLAKETQPKWVLIENVKGLLTYRRGYFKTLITKKLQDIGYDVSARVLSAADFGVPQLRHRIFFIGNRIDAPIEFPEPSHTGYETLFSDQLKPYVTVDEAIGDLPLMNGELNSDDWDYAFRPKSEFQKYARQYNPRLTLHQSNGVSKQASEIIQYIGEGQGLRSVPVEHLPARFKKMRTISTGALRKDCTTLYYRLSRTAPGYTITCYFRNVASGPFLHPLENRSLSFREAARLMSFQDRYRFCGRKLAMQIGNAVPPLMAKAVGKAILDQSAAFEDAGQETTAAA